jgi:hypothetical protein
MTFVLEPVLLLPSVFKSVVLSFSVPCLLSEASNAREWVSQQVSQKELPQLDDFGCAIDDGYRGRNDITYEAVTRGVAASG